MFWFIVKVNFAIIKLLWQALDLTLFFFALKLQYPVRPSSLSYDHTPHLAARMKPKQQKVNNIIQSHWFITWRLFQIHCLTWHIWCLVNISEDSFDWVIFIDVEIEHEQHKRKQQKLGQGQPWSRAILLFIVSNKSQKIISTYSNKYGKIK